MKGKMIVDRTGYGFGIGIGVDHLLVTSFKKLLLVVDIAGIPCKAFSEGIGFLLVGFESVAFMFDGSYSLYFLHHSSGAVPVDGALVQCRWGGVQYI